jgi:phytoene synthase
MTGSAADSLESWGSDREALAHARAVTERSGSSFFGAMRVLPPLQRQAMYAIYAFCREVDDIADDPAPPARKLARLGEWRREIDRLYDGRPSLPTARALIGPVKRFALRKDDFLALIEGMEMDAAESLRGPDIATLEHYCACVAGAVGLLSVRVFGATGPPGRQLAWAEGQALQLTNILRDLAEDAGRGRLYLPAELLDRHGIASRDPQEVLRHDALPGVCEDLAEVALKRFALADCGRRSVRPAAVMLHVYRRTLDLLMARGWRRLDEPVRVSKPTKLWYALRYGVL